MGRFIVGLICAAAIGLAGCGDSASGGGGNNSGTGGGAGSQGTGGTGGPGAITDSDPLGPPMGPVLDTTFDCVLLADHRVICGADDLLLEELTGDRNADEQLYVVALPTSMGRRPVELAGFGQSHCTRLEDGTIQCWGENRGGTLGDGSPTSVARVEPGAVPGVSDSIRLIGTDNTMCSLSRDGRVLCWGRVAPEGGEGTATPEEVDVPGGVIDLSFARGGLCALLETGGVVCQGEPRFGVPVGTEDEDLLPIPGTENAVALDGNCAFFASGVPTCWGDEITAAWGENGEEDVGSFPFDDVVNLGVRFGVSVALRADGSVWFCGSSGCGRVELPCDLTEEAGSRIVRLVSLAILGEPTLAAETENGTFVAGTIVRCGSPFSGCTDPDARHKLVWYVNDEQSAYRSDLDPICAFVGVCLSIGQTCPYRFNLCGTTTNACQGEAEMGAGQ